MKKTLKVTALSLALALTSTFAAAAENIAVINGEYLFQNHPDRKAVADKLEGEFKPARDKLVASKKQVEEKIAAAQKKIEAKVTALQKEAPKLRAADIKKREDEIKKLEETENTAINKLISAHDEEAKKFQEAYAKRENEETRKIIDSIESAIKAVAKQKQYTLVLNQTAAAYVADESKNINEEVLKAIPASAPAK